jgi:osmotically-inducible protein OsmY
MRRFFLGMAIASLTAGAPLTALGGDREIADAIITSVKKSQVSLSGLEIDLTVENGYVLVTGKTVSQAQLDAVLDAARSTAGVKSVENQAACQSPAVLVKSDSAKNVIPASASDSSIVFGDSDRDQISDQEITSSILGQLGEAKRDGQLRNFDINVTTADGEVTVRGIVASNQQKDLVLGTAKQAFGVRRVMDELEVSSGRSGVRSTTVSDARGLAQENSNVFVTRAANVGNAGPVAPSGAVNVGGNPRAFAASNISNVPMQVAPVQGAPVAAGVVAPQAPMPMNAGPSYGAGVPRQDSPYMPGYAWPSYAAYPNYAAVTYPKQYSASAWPYIGPFYPYPQVPLGWRRVSLEWDDGLWYLDFTHK